MPYTQLANIDSLPANAALGQYVFKKEVDGTYTAFLVLADDEAFDTPQINNQQPEYLFVAA